MVNDAGRLAVGPADEFGLFNLRCGFNGSSRERYIIAILLARVCARRIVIC